MGMEGHSLVAAVKALSGNPNLKTRTNNRISSSIRFYIKNKIFLVSGTVSDEKPLTLTHTIEEKIRESPSTLFFAYTDGSTNPKAHSPNSGCGVFITDHQEKAVFSGGLVVRSDGNNFIPELAAVSCVVKAIPKNVHVTLRSDSLATIGALHNARVSGRILARISMVELL